MFVLIETKGNKIDPWLDSGFTIYTARNNLPVPHLLAFGLLSTLSVVSSAVDRSKLGSNLKETFDQEQQSVVIKMRFVFKHLLILSSLLFIGCQSNDNYNSEVDDIQNGKYIEFIEELSEYSNDPSISSSSSSMNEKNIKHSSRTASLYATETVTNRFSNMFSSKVKSPECRAKVASHFRRYIDAIVNHEALPYVEQKFPYDCPKGHLDYNNLPEGVTFQTLMGTTYQPPPDEAEYIDHPSNLKLLYGILMHENASSTIRLIETLNENNTIFVIHVDGKENSDDAYHELIEYSKKVENVHVVPNEFRIRVNWGGFTMVNAT